MKLCQWVLIFLLCSASVGRAQYIGTNRPLTAAQAAAMDAAKTDTTRFKADSTAKTAQINELSGRVDAGGALVQRDSLRLDSLAAAKIGRSYYKAGANVTITTHGAPGDSATISASGGGGDSGFEPLPLPQSLTEMYSRNVKQIVTLADIQNWADSVAGTFADAQWEYTIVKTDTVALKMVATEASTGAHVSMRDPVDLTHFAGGDTSTTADYITMALYVDSVSLARMGTGIQLSPMCSPYPTVSQFFAYDLHKGVLAAGWNYIKTAKSAFIPLGSPGPSWSTIYYFAPVLIGAPSDTVTLIFDNLQLIRKDSTDARPMALWQSGSAPWSETATSAVTIYDGGIQSMISGDYVTGANAALDTLGPLRVVVAQADSSRLASRRSGLLNLTAAGGTKIYLDSAGVRRDSVSLPYAAGDTLTARLFIGASGTVTATVRCNSGTDSTLTATYSGAGSDCPRIQLFGSDRLLDLPDMRTNIIRLQAGAFWYYLHADSTWAQ